MELKVAYTVEDFKRLVSREDRIERKTGVGQKPLQDALVALSNTDGGAIVIGVDDSSRVVGRRLDQGTEDKIHEAALSAHQLGRYSIKQIQVGRTSVVAVRVHQRIEGFSQTSGGRVLVRRGGHNVTLFGPDLARFISERRLHRFEETDVGVRIEEAEADLLSELCKAFGWGRDRGLADRLREKGLATREGTLTVAGSLFLTNPSNSLGQRKAMVEVRRYSSDSTNYDRREVFGGPVHHQVAQSTEFVVGELGIDVVVTGLYRHELPRVPEVVIREAIANAVAHRSYEAQGTATVIDITPSTVVVTSPGGLPEPVTIETLRQAQAARNPDVIDVLRRFRLAEDAGRGIDVMEDSMRDAMLDPPQFVDLTNGVRVTLPLKGPITPRERAWVADLERRGEIEGGDRLLLVHAARGRPLTNTRAREVLSVGRAEAREALRRLRDAGLVEQHGERGGASYTLVEEIAPPAAFRMTPPEIRKHVLDAAKKQPLTNELVRELTGLERPAALALLRQLVAEGRLRKRGAKRGTRYERV